MAFYTLKASYRHSEYAGLLSSSKGLYEVEEKQRES